MKKIIYIVAIPGSIQSFLVDRMHYLSDTYNVQAVCSPGPEHEEFKKQGLVTHAIPIARRIAPLRDVVSLFQLYRFLRKERPDIVHTMTPKAGLLGILAAWAARIPVRIAMFNGELKLPSKITRAIVRITNALTCMFATHLNADGFGTRQYVIDQKITHKPVTVFWKGNINGVDLDKFSLHGNRALVRQLLGICDSTVVYIYVGRIVHDKGIDELIPTFVQLQRIVQNVVLIMVGDEEILLDPILDSTREQMNNNSSIFYVGKQNNIPDWLEASDVFVLPSHREGCNCSLIEAGAMRLPCIASDIGGCRDIIKDGVNGLLFPVKNKDALLSVMLHLYHSPQLRNDLSMNARVYVKERYNRKDVWREMLKFYSSLHDWK